MCGSCHYVMGASNDEFIFGSERSPIDSNYLFNLGTPNFKNQPWLKSITITNIQNSTLNLSFDALLK